MQRFWLAFIVFIISQVAWGKLLSTINFPPGARVGIFHGTFDPPTLAHDEVIKKSLEKLDYVVVVPNNMTIHKLGAAPSILRHEMLDMVYHNHERILTPDLHFSKSLVEHSAVVARVKEKCPDAKIVGIIGDDIIDGIIRRFLIDVSSYEELIVFTRDGLAEEIPKEIASRPVTIMEGSSGISSSEVRAVLTSSKDMVEFEERLFNGELPLLDAVKEYIFRNQMYFFSYDHPKYLCLHLIDKLRW